MKKFFSLLAIVALFSFLFSSCKSHEVCPAYGKVTHAKTQAAKQS